MALGGTTAPVSTSAWGSTDRVSACPARGATDDTSRACPAAAARAAALLAARGAACCATFLSAVRAASYSTALSVIATHATLAAQPAARIAKRRHRHDLGATAGVPGSANLSRGPTN